MREQASEEVAMKFDQEYDVVEVGKLEEHPQNPRVGNVDVIDESMEVNGWYGAVVAQKSTGFILAGNHRFRVAKERGAKTIPVIYRDVDDETAIRILLVDNKSADAGGYDEALLAELLEGLETLDGTGYGLGALEDGESPGEGEEGLEEGVPEDRYEPSYGVMVVCTDEDHQREVFDSLSEEDYELRVVAV
jgi:ParB-like chromosome segregation protein Spo0J